MGLVKLEELPRQREPRLVDRPLGQIASIIGEGRTGVDDTTPGVQVAVHHSRDVERAIQHVPQRLLRAVLRLATSKLPQVLSPARSVGEQNRAVRRQDCSGQLLHTLTASAAVDQNTS